MLTCDAASTGGAVVAEPVPGIPASPPDVHSAEGSRPAGRGWRLECVRSLIAAACRWRVCFPRDRRRRLRVSLRRFDRPSPSPRSPAERTRQTAADAARELSLLEAERAFDELYERMHPDALAVVPRSAVVGWYESFFADRETAEIRVDRGRARTVDVGRHGVTYQDAVTVRFVQPYTVDGDGD